MALAGEQLLARLVDRLDRIGNLEAEEPGQFVQAPGVLVELEDDAAIGALALEDGAGIVQAVREHVERGVRPRHERAVHPDDAGAIVERLGSHRGSP